MSTAQIEAQRARIPVPIVALLVAGAFAIGGLTGLALPLTASSGIGLDAAAPAAGAVVPGVAVNNMSAAADRAFANLSAGAVVPGVAVNNMSAAADRAFLRLAQASAR